MRKDVAGCRRQKNRRCIGVDRARDGGGAGGARIKGGQNSGLARAPVRDQPVEPAARVCNRIAMAGIEHPPLPRRKPRAGGHEIGEVPIGRRDQRTGPAHHVIAGQAGVVPAEADVIAQMAGRMDHLERPVRAGNRLAVADPRIGGKAVIDSFAAALHTRRHKLFHDRAAPRVRPAEGQNRRARRLRQWPGKGGVIEMAVGDDDVADPLTGFNGGKDGPQVCCAVRAGVDHRQILRAQQIGVGAPKGHR